MDNINKIDRVAVSGEKNGRWSGGVNSYYKNHYQLKLNRKEKMKQVGSLCEKCGKKVPLFATHKDGDKDNHIIINLEMLCSRCRPRSKDYNSKYVKKFGKSMETMKNKYNLTEHDVYKKCIKTSSNEKEIKIKLEKLSEENNK